MTLWHYTCDHGLVELGQTGIVLPMDTWNPRAARLLVGSVHEAMTSLSWFTDLAEPWPRALGLTRDTITCDRSAHRYRVIDSCNVMPWLRHPLRKGALRDLERAPGAMPRHWYVATVGVPVVLAERSVSELEGTTQAKP